MPRVLKNRALIEPDARRFLFLIILTAVYFLEPLTNCDSLQALVNELAGSAAFIAYQEETKSRLHPE
jgi:hypothetical protein